MTIKEFSKLCNCTTQTLRYYDSIQLLKPARVDPFTGYRYYDEEQAMDYIRIKNLQDAMFSIEEIKELLAKEDDVIVRAFDAKIAEQRNKLDKMIQIQKSYRSDYRKMKELIEATKNKINESVGNYNVTLEYGISKDYYQTIIEEMNAQYDQAMEEEGDFDFRFARLSDKDMDDEAPNPLRDGCNEVIATESGWRYTKEVLEKLPILNGKYLLYFELDEKKWTYNDFCIVVMRIVQERNKEDFQISCTRNRSKDGKNHFWLIKPAQ